MTSAAPGEALIVGTRGSVLALRQTEMVIAALRAMHPALDVTVRLIATKGDVMRDVPLSAIGGRGVFVGPHAHPQDRERMAARVRRRPARAAAP